MKKQTQKIFLGITLVLLLAIGIYTFGIQESILSASSINVGTDGKVYWTFFASANKPNEQYVFNYYTKNYTLPNGNIVDPKEDLVLVINPGNPECIYQTIKVTRFIEADYYVLNNPQKKMLIDIADSNGIIKTLDGTTVSSVVIDDKDGKGSLTVETQGLLSGKYNCPSNSDVALVKQKDGTIKFYYRSDLEDASYLDIINLIQKITLAGYQSNTIFTNTFSSPVTLNDKGEVIGTIAFGYPTFTITADQDYFDSITYIPPKLAKPIISKINLPDKITKDGSSSMTVEINNNGEKGLISISTESSTYSISPTSTNTELDKNALISFTIKAPNVIKCGDIKVTACSTNQFGTNDCNSKSENLCIVEDTIFGGASEICGDNICQSNENFNTCQLDCKSEVTQEQEFECKFYQSYYEKDSKFFGLIAGKQGCATSGWVYFVIILLVITLIIVSIVIYNKKFK